MFEKMKAFVKEIGKYSFEALEKQHEIYFKEDHDAVLSIVTEVDLHNSLAFEKFAAENVADLNYVLIDEESIDRLDGYLFEKIEGSEYQFVLDPIDGTLNYSAGLPFYGVLLAVFKNKQPLYGFIYTPALNDFVYTNGKQVFREHDGKTEVLNNIPRNFSRIVQAHAWEVSLKPEHIKGKFIVEDYFSAAVYSLYLCMGKLRAAVAAAKIWDIAPLLAIGKVCGIGLYDYHTKEEMTLSPKFVSDRGKVKHMMIMSHKDDFDDVKDIFSDAMVDDS